MLKTTPDFWRNIALHRQGFGENGLFGTGVAGVEQALNTLGYIQIDTLYVIERAHHHSLWNRVEDYQSDDLDKLVALHHKIIAALPAKQIFRSDDLSFMEANLHRRGRTVGAFLRGKLIGYAVISFPKGDTDNLGELAPINESDIIRVAHYDGAAVDPDYRGNNLHRFMNTIRGDYAIAAGYYHLMGTVSPLNPYSLGNHLLAGFELVDFATKYDVISFLLINCF